MTQKFICAHIETPEQIFTWLIANRDKISKGKLYNKRISLMIFANNGSVTFNTVAAYTDMPDDIPKDSLLILAPAFLISELSQAFQMGFLIYLPFLVIDMTIANLLMALGMQMLSPTTISLPFKLLLFVLVDGFRVLSEGLIS